MLKLRLRAAGAVPGGKRRDWFAGCVCGGGVCRVGVNTHRNTTGEDAGTQRRGEGLRQQRWPLATPSSSELLTTDDPSYRCPAIFKYCCVFQVLEMTRPAAMRAVPSDAGGRHRHWRSRCRACAPSHCSASSPSHAVVSSYLRRKNQRMCITRSLRGGPNARFHLLALQNDRRWCSSPDRNPGAEQRSRNTGRALSAPQQAQEAVKRLGAAAPYSNTLHCMLFYTTLPPAAGLSRRVTGAAPAGAWAQHSGARAVAGCDRGSA